ncbi:hypothetical protein DDF67_19250 [Caulobacter endophyticus]|uniref:Tat pathway signal protein n=2 Tax=Caulobacter endophyticus TaxID=2172652 RepID=A0A2T9JLS6_9CAUL|nr:hypothetical protein DDF67_19250 [Caulobacter endophyticus]
MRKAMRRTLALLAAVLTLAGLCASPALASGGEAKKEAPPTYFALPTITASAIRRDGRKGVMTLETGIEAKDPKVMEYAQASTPRLRAAFAQVLMTYASGLRRGAAPDLDYIGAEMQKAADRTLGRKGARVLLGSAMVN